MFKQYEAIKARHKDCILFFRLGDFYEMFYDDAKKASGILDIVLTSRGKTPSGKIPMCGIPYHAADSYIAKLIKAGERIAICEQTEDPSQAKGIVKRDVTRIITSGTFIDDTSSNARYILSISPNKNHIGIAFTDSADGRIETNQYSNIDKLREVLSKILVYECIFPMAEQEKIKGLFRHPSLKIKNTTLTPYDDWPFNHEIAEKSLNEHFGTTTLKGFGIDSLEQAISSSGALIEYLKQMNKQPMRHIDKISLYQDTDYVFISPAAVYGLEMESLIKTMDHTLTPMGKRMLRYAVYHPIKNHVNILNRQQAVSLLKDSPEIQERLHKLLRNMPDIEKAISRISCGYTSAKDFLALRSSITRAPDIQETLSSLTMKNSLFSIAFPYDIRILLEKAINPDTPISHPEGKIINKGYHHELDDLRDIQENGKKWLQRLQKQEIEKTKINSLKIGFNKIFGYYIEITKPNIHLAPAEYIRRQTLAHAERFITPELKEFEEKMFTAEEKVLKIEQQILQDIQKSILDESISLHQFSSGLAVIDFIYSLSKTALLPGYTAPEINESDKIIIKEGCHPVVEKSITEPFIPNDTFMDSSENSLLIITGPNMSGKSTYIRQVAILVIMAQTGSFIPAQSASIGIVDKIFTRIGAHDEITKGQSTFMVEMSETAEILNNISPRSLIIMDEIGRGTSTFDGLSLAWAIAEFLAAQNVRVLFATHFHELTELQKEYKNVKNYNVAVKEWKDEIIFLHKIIQGGADDSYGIYVAKLAGIPKEVLARSKEILTKLELYSNLDQKILKKPREKKQFSLFSEIRTPAMEEIQKDIVNIDVNSLTPLDALQKINQWKEKLSDKKRAL